MTGNNSIAETGFRDGETWALGDLLPRLADDPRRGLSTSRWSGNGNLVVPLGFLRHPGQQGLAVYSPDLSGSAGNLGVTGPRQSGKTTLLHTLICGLALTHTPEELQVYGLDHDGGLDPVAGLPHVGGLAGRGADSGTPAQITAALTGLVRQRKERFEQADIGSMALFRVRKRHGQITDDPFGDVFLVIDDWNTRADRDDLSGDLAVIAEQGLRYGVHLAIATERWADLPEPLRQGLTTTIEFPPADASESRFGPEFRDGLPAGCPGYALTAAPDPVLLAVALPRIDGAQVPDGLPGGTVSLVSRVSQAWTGKPAPALSALAAPAADAPPAPEPVPQAAPQLPAQPQPQSPPAGAGFLRVPVGLDTNQGPVELDLEEDPLIVVFGEPGSGKTSFLRLLARTVSANHDPQRVMILAAGYRGSLEGAVPDGPVPEGHLLFHAGDTEQLTSVMRDLAEVLRQRLPGPDVTPEQRADRSWWKGAHVLVLVDDYDLVTTAPDHPMAGLASLIPHARDIGMHLVVARQTAGAGKSLGEPVLRVMMGHDAAALILSGDPAEGPLCTGVRPSAQPPGRGYFVRPKQGYPVLVQLTGASSAG